MSIQNLIDNINATSTDVLKDRSQLAFWSHAYIDAVIALRDAQGALTAFHAETPVDCTGYETTKADIKTRQHLEYEVSIKGAIVEYNKLQLSELKTGFSKRKPEMIYILSGVYSYSETKTLALYADGSRAVLDGLNAEKFGWLDNDNPRVATENERNERVKGWLDIEATSVHGLEVIR